ncbi:arginine--tRNA ligase [Clostridium manihotivorum]|uniref:Arginine--tRNA ligase n=1 Tax=Clostridium manihotivorum TaxID=2320868 RepID=A0A410DWM4_9CLOT|nr:arginine--tRNA ligase [Clostridium manihotivorum]QAA33653.1 arginine--tRNA ligase [Clostridium manihotivorum]
MNKIVTIISSIVESAFVECGYDSCYGNVTVSNRPDLCQYQCNGAMAAAKVYKKRPSEIASEVIEKLKASEIFSEVTIVNPGFINMNLKDEFISEYINKINSCHSYGVEITDNPKKIIIDYGGANISKPLHVGHLRTAIIGEALKRMGRFLGNEVIGDVHLGDWGLPMGMVISEIKSRNPNLPYFSHKELDEYSSKAPFTISDLEEIYPTASKKAKEDSVFMEEAKMATFYLQNGKKGYLALWRHILKISTEDLKKNYGKLNVEFDLWKGESDCHKYIDKLTSYLKEHNYAYESEGALIIDVAEPEDKKPIPPFILLKSDGAVLYSTTDLATIYERVMLYKPDLIMYVVDKRQSLHFEQVFRCAKKTGIAGEALNLQFIGYGTMNGKDGKPFKTRDGGTMRLEELIKQVQQKVKEKITMNNSDLDMDEIEDISRIVGLSSLKYGDLSNQISKDYIFDIDKFTSFEGKTGPYILYTIVRIKSILRKAAERKLPVSSSIGKPQSNTERDIMLKLSLFSDIVETSFEEKVTHKLCEYMFELSNLFNKFYQENKILTEQNLELQGSWLSLLSLIKGVLETCCSLLAIEVPERM